MTLKKIKENCRCNIEFKSKKSHVEHYKIVHEKYQECPKCSKLVRDPGERGHRCEKPKPATPKKGSTCPECGKYYERELSMWYHINATHSKTPVACEICGKEFSSRTSLADHRPVHEGRTFCNVCNKLCSTVANLRRHMKTHQS